MVDYGSESVNKKLSIIHQINESHFYGTLLHSQVPACWSS